MTIPGIGEVTALRWVLEIGDVDRFRHLQTVLIEAARLSPRWNKQLSKIHTKELTKGNRNRATLAVARRLVAYMLAVEKRQTDFKPVLTKETA